MLQNVRDDPCIYIRAMKDDRIARAIRCWETTPEGVEELRYRWECRMDLHSYYLDMREVDAILHQQAREESRDAAEYRRA